MDASILAVILFDMDFFLPCFLRLNPLNCRVAFWRNLLSKNVIG